MKVLITGANGFVGRHLCAHLLSLGTYELHGTHIEAHLSPDAPAIQWHQLDLREAAPTLSLLQKLQPDLVFHLAAQAFVPQSYEDPWETLENNIRGQVNLLEGLRQAAIPARILVISSAHVYGKIQAEDNPIRETQAFAPDSPYSVSKAAQDLLAQQYHLAHGLHTVRARPFNHIGPGQNTRFALPNFADQIAAAELGQAPPVIEVGNLAASRDFTDVRDVVRAYHLMLTQGQAGAVYNVCSGLCYTMEHLLNLLCAQSHIPLEVRTRPDRFRPLDIPKMQGDASRLHQDTGWQATIDIQQSLGDILNFYRKLRKSTL